MNPASCEIEQSKVFSMLQEDVASSGSSAAPRTEAESQNSPQVAAHETPLPTPPAASATATEVGVVTQDESRKKPLPLPFPPFFVAQQTQQVEAASQLKRPRTEDNAFQSRIIPCVCWDTLGESPWYNVLSFLAPTPPEDIFMNLYVQGCLRNDSLCESSMPRPLRGCLRHDGRSVLICERQLPLSEDGSWCAKGWVMELSGDKQYYHIWIRDNFGLVQARQLWNYHGSRWYTPDYAWRIIGYDVQKWKVVGDNDLSSIYHAIPPLCKMILGICCSIPDFRYKYCLYAEIDIDIATRDTSFFGFSTSDEARQFTAILPAGGRVPELAQRFTT